MAQITDFFSYFRKKDVIIGELPPIWDMRRISIYDFLRSQPEDTEFEYIILPDQDTANDNGVRFAAGAMDGILGHHTAGEENNKGEKVYALLRETAMEPTKIRLEKLYAKLNSDVSALGIADELIARIIEDPLVDAESLQYLGLWLATKSPDREPVKFGIMLLGIIDTPESVDDVLMTLGLHDEFTLFVTVAFGNIYGRPERDRILWELARNVHGWGRIHVVERLAETEDRDIRAWLLREGFKNSVMDEYLAYACAKGGRLLEALQADVVDEALLVGAGEILSALINGGPVEDISVYDDGAEVTSLFVNHLAKTTADTLLLLYSLENIKTFINNDEIEWQGLEKLGWNRDLRTALKKEIALIKAESKWRCRVEKDLKSEDDQLFWVAAEVAPYIGIDPWQIRFDRQKTDPDADEWFYLVQSDDEARVEQVLMLVREQVNLETLTMGRALAADTAGHFEFDLNIDMLLSMVERFPGKGIDIVKAALRSPIERTRYSALQCIGLWDVDKRSQALLGGLSEAIKIEPDEQLKEKMADVLAGGKIRHRAD